MPSKRGNVYLYFRNSLLKYVQNKRRHNFIITRITVDYPVQEKLKAVIYSLPSHNQHNWTPVEYLIILHNNRTQTRLQH